MTRCKILCLLAFLLHSQQIRPDSSAHSNGAINFYLFKNIVSLLLQDPEITPGPATAVG